MYNQEMNQYIMNLVKSVKRTFLFKNRDRIVSYKVCKPVIERLKSNIPDVAAKSGILAFSAVPSGTGVISLRNEKFIMKYICVVLIDDTVYDVYNDILGVSLDEYVKLYPMQLVVNTIHTDCEMTDAAIKMLDEAGIITDKEYYGNDSEEVVNKYQVTEESLEFTECEYGAEITEATVINNGEAAYV